jgi:hypothetical protein
MSTVRHLLGRCHPGGDAVLLGVLLVLGEGLLAVSYVALFRPEVTQPLMVVLVPFVWLNLSLWVFLRVRPAAADSRQWPAALVAVAYFGILAVLGGLAFDGGATASGLRVRLALFPGWAPMLIYDGAIMDLLVVPFKLVGYLALTYLVYVTARDAAGAVLGGAVGLLSCVSCSFPIIAGLVTSVAGGGAAAAVYSNSYPLSTVVFALTVGLLSWRPSIASLSRLRAR